MKNLITMTKSKFLRVGETAEKMTYIELNTEPCYMNKYTAALFLLHTDIDLFPSVKQIINLWGKEIYLMTHLIKKP